MSLRFESPSDDLKLVREIMEGSIDAWHRFVERASPLIHSVLRRYLHDRDEIATVYVDLLEDLYRHRLATFLGRSTLSTWLVVLARRAAVDTLRRRLGRSRWRRGAIRLGPLESQVLRLYFERGLSLEAVCHQLCAANGGVARSEVIEALVRIETTLGTQTLRGLRYERGARGTAHSPRLLEFLDSVQAEHAHAEARSPEWILLEQEVRETERRVLGRLDELPPGERQAVVMRFGRGWSAKRVAIEVGLEGPRQVRTVLKRALDRMREWTRAEKDTPPGCPTRANEGLDR